MEWKVSIRHRDNAEKAYGVEKEIKNRRKVILSRVGSGGWENEKWRARMVALRYLEILGGQFGQKVNESKSIFEGLVLRRRIVKERIK